MRRETDQPGTRPQPDPVLRPLHRDDVDDVLSAFRSNPDMARQAAVTTRAEAAAYLERLLAPSGAHRPWALDVAGRLVGLVCVSVDDVNRNGWFFYWLADEARGHGWMKRAAATVADWALTTGGVERLELGHRVNNPASGSVARAAGFVKEGTERGKFLIDGVRVDVDTYARLRTDPVPAVEPLEMLRG